MEIIILAGGFGTRLKSAIGSEIPKCMAPIADKPFLWFILNYLNRFDIDRVVLSLGHLSQVIIDYVESNKADFKYDIKYSIETLPLGTGGGIKLALSKCSEENVIVMNGDTIFNIDLDDFLRKHILKKSVITLALKPMINTDRYGSVILNPQNHIIEGFIEKKPGLNGLINGGIYAINKNLIIWPDINRFSFEKDVLEPTVTSKEIYGFPYNAYFIDIGIPNDYMKAQSDFNEIF